MFATKFVLFVNRVTSLRVHAEVLVVANAVAIAAKKKNMCIHTTLKSNQFSDQKKKWHVAI